MRSKITAAAAVLSAIVLTACGNIGRPDPTTITRINDDKGAKSYGNETDKEPTKEQDKKAVTTTAAAEEKQPEEAKKEGPAKPSEDTQAAAAEQQRIDTLVKKTMGSMTTEQKVGQLFIIRADALETDFSNVIVNDDNTYGVTLTDEQMTYNLGIYQVGGITVSGKNIVDDEQLKTLISDLQAASEIPLFVAANEEGGENSVLAGSSLTGIKSFESIAAIKDEESAKALGSDIGTYLSGYGINVDLAPCADVGSEGYMISSDPNTAADLVGAELEGFSSSGVITVMKHFPGGSAEADDENGVLDTNSMTWAQLLESSVVPYKVNLEKTDMIMAGHILCPKVTDDGLPASMSAQLLTDKLRNELGYEGVIITDNMGSADITTNYFLDESVVDAIEAGADMILTPYDLAKSYNAVLAAVESGDISAQRLDESVERIIRLKAEKGLIR